MFQSTFPRRERLFSIIQLIYKGYVSIHVPAKGTTHSGNDILYQHHGFNPRSREGNDTKGVSPTGALWMFQSTFPRRERLVRRT